MSRETTDGICCQKCGEEVSPGFKFCTSCGAPIKEGYADLGDRGTDGYVHSVLCPECGAELSPPSRFCTVCGKRIGTVTAWSFDECYCCGAKLTPGQRFCTQCGESFDRPTSAQIKKALEAKRREQGTDYGGRDTEVQFEDLKRNFHELESKFFSAVDNAIDSAGSVLLNPGGNGSREDGGTYLVCDRCNAHYRVRPLDDLSDFSGTCECGGKLRFIEKFRR